MPYIKKINQDYYGDSLQSLIDDLRHSAFGCGDLNYIFSQIAGAAFNEKPCYQTINDVVGALDGAKVEFQRRVVGPYEDKKIIENGDIDEYHKFETAHVADMMQKFYQKQSDAAELLSEAKKEEHLQSIDVADKLEKVDIQLGSAVKELDKSLTKLTEVTETKKKKSKSRKTKKK